MTQKMLTKRKKKAVDAVEVQVPVREEEEREKQRKLLQEELDKYQKMRATHEANYKMKTHADLRNAFDKFFVTQYNKLLQRIPKEPILSLMEQAIDVQTILCPI